MIVLHRGKCVTRNKWVVGYITGIKAIYAENGNPSIYHFKEIDGAGRESLCTVYANTVTPISNNLDINSLPICDYDIVEFECGVNAYKDSATGVCSVHSEPVMNRALVVFDGRTWKLDYLKYNDVTDFVHWSQMKVIGNIFDNPELIDKDVVDLNTNPSADILSCIKQGWRGAVQKDTLLYFLKQNHLDPAKVKIKLFSKYGPELTAPIERYMNEKHMVLRHVGENEYEIILNSK